MNLTEVWGDVNKYQPFTAWLGRFKLTTSEGCENRPKLPYKRELLQTRAKSDAILLHSLPRMDEIPPDVDITRWSRYWQEAFCGVVMRMALIALVLGKME